MQTALCAVITAQCQTQMACADLKIGEKTMAEYIDREAFLEHMKSTNRYFDVKFDIEDFPAADVAPVQKWISVKDRLPEAGGYVVCIAKRNPFSRFMPMVAKIEKNGWVNPITEQYISDVSHWMPIPEPPKEK